MDRRVELAAQRVDHHHRDDREGRAKEHHLADQNRFAERAHQRLPDGELSAEASLSRIPLRMFTCNVRQAGLSQRLAGAY